MLHWVTPLVPTVSWLPPLTSLPVILFSHPLPATGHLTRTLISPESCNQHSLYSRHLLSGWETFPAQNLQLHTHPIPDSPCSLLYYNLYLPFVYKISWIKLLYIFVYFIISSQGAAIFFPLLFTSLYSGPRNGIQQALKNKYIEWIKSWVSYILQSPMKIWSNY